MGKENTMVLTPEEVALIERRRKREAKKADNDNKLIKEVFAKLPTRAKLLKLLGVGSAPIELSKTIRCHVGGLFLRSNGTVGYDSRAYSNTPTKTSNIPVYWLESKNIVKVGGTKTPFIYTLEAKEINNKIVDFQLWAYDPTGQICPFILLQDKAISEYQYQSVSSVLFIQKEAEMKELIKKKLKAMCASMVDNAEYRIQRAREELKYALNKKKELKVQLGSYYKSVKKGEE